MVRTGSAASHDERPAEDLLCRNRLACCEGIVWLSYDEKALPVEWRVCERPVLLCDRACELHSAGQQQVAEQVRGTDFYPDAYAWMALPEPGQNRRQEAVGNPTNGSD